MADRAQPGIDKAGSDSPCSDGQLTHWIILSLLIVLSCLRRVPYVLCCVELFLIVAPVVLIGRSKP